MTDLEILRKIEGRIGKKFEKVSEDEIIKKFDKEDYSYYSINKNDKITGLSIFNINYRNFYDLMISFKNLQYLYLSHNNLDLSVLTDFINLSYLSLRCNQLSNITPLKNLTNLNTLDISHNQIIDISALKDLTNLNSLNISHNNILIDITPLKNLTNLNTLDISHNQLRNISPLKDLINLNTLYLTGNQIREISSLKDLTNLNILDLSSNQIIDISALKDLTNLNILDLKINQITDISALKDLTNLTILNLRNNHVSDILPLKDLKKLELLNLKKNKIKKLQEWIIRFQKIYILEEHLHFLEKGLNLDGNPIESPPIEIFKQGKDAIKNYFENLKKSQEVELFEAKLLIVGEGEVGKTSLMKKLIDPNIDISQEKTTEGIDIRRWDVKTNKTNDFRINIWDFGGQEIYHSTHQFFLTKRSLYLFVWEARKDTDILSFDYWLSTIRILTNESPIIVVLNKTDERIKTIDEKSIQEKFPNIIGFFRVSAKTGSGIDELSQIIRNNIENLPHVGNKLPKTWIDIRKELEDLNKNYINYIEYEDICKEYDLNEEKSMFLSRYYHDLGVFLNFSDNPILKEIIFLKPEWATDAVYKVLDTKEILLKKGKFNLTDIELIWKGYPKTQHKNLLELMKKFELCFKIPEIEEYIIPELLSQERTDFNWEYEDNLQFEYQYDFMPAGIMPRFKA